MTTWDRRAILDLGPMTEAFGTIDDEAKAALALFLSTIRPLLSSIQMRLLAGDLPGAAADAHSAKGAANVTGAFRLGALCDEICRQLKQGDSTEAQNVLALVPDAIDEVQAAIRRL
jgi:HPt (histidine-containing phosphotransfer) domain-containing protein